MEKERSKNGLEEDMDEDSRGNGLEEDDWSGNSREEDMKEDKWRNVSMSNVTDYKEMILDLSVGKLSTDEITNSGLSPKTVKAMLHQINTLRSEKPSKHICEHCRRIFVHEEKLKTHCKFAHGKKLYSFYCATCDEDFIEQWFYWNHITLNHPDVVDKLKCIDCGEQFRNKPDFVKHTVFIHKPHLRNVFKIKLHDAQMAIIENDAKLTRRRVKTVVEDSMVKAKRKKNEKARICNTCGMFLRGNKLNYDMHSHRHEKFVTFRGKRAMKDFNAFFSENEQSYSCGYCEEKFEPGDNFTHHLQRKHAADIVIHGWNTRLFRCLKCEKIYKEERLLVDHVQRRHIVKTESFDDSPSPNHFTQTEDIYNDWTDYSETESDGEEMSRLFFSPDKPRICPLHSNGLIKEDSEEEDVFESATSSLSGCDNLL